MWEFLCYELKWLKKNAGSNYQAEKLGSMNKAGLQGQTLYSYSRVFLS